MTLYTVDGTFTGRLNDGSSGATLSGTIDVDPYGAVTAMDLVVPGFTKHFTEIYFNQPNDGRWLLSAQTPGSCECYGGEEDYLVFTFSPAPQATSFQAKLTYGAAVHNSISMDGMVITTYYGYSLQGTICPLEGCVPFPPPPPLMVPGPEAGTGLGIALAMVLLVRALKNKWGERVEFC